MDELRLALIGNDDLKWSLLKDGSFALWLKDAFHKEAKKLTTQQEHGSSVTSIVADRGASFDLIEELHKLVVVMRLLSEHILESLKPAPAPELFDSIGGSISFLISVVEYAQDSNTLGGGPLTTILCIIFDIIIILGNTLSSFVAYMDFKKLWRFLCSLSLTEANKTIVTSALKLVPFLLQGMSESSLDDVEFSSILISHLIKELEVLFDNVSDNFLNIEEGFQLLDIGHLQNLMVATAQLLNCVKAVKPEQHNTAMEAFFERPQTQKCMLSLLYIEDAYVLNLATLNLFQIQLLSSSEVENEDGSPNETFRKLYPRIIELLQRDSLEIPKNLNYAISVLLDLCLKYSGVCVHLRNTNTDLKIMRDLLKLFDEASIFLRLRQIKMSLRDGKHVANFTVLRNGTSEVASEDWFKELDVIANFLLLLSVYTSSNEDFRRRITSFSATNAQKNSPNFICLMIFEMTESYKFFINQILLNYEILRHTRQQDTKWIASNIGVLMTLLEHPIFTNTFYLMRSLSRSVSTLRTFFVDCNSIRSTFETTDDASEDHQPANKIVSIVEARYDREVSFDRRGNLIFGMLDILSKLEVTGHVMLYLTSSGDKARQHKTRKDFYVKKVITLAVVANFILDFSSFRHEIVKRVESLNDLASLLQKSIQTKAKCHLNMLALRESREIAFEQLRIQLAILQLVKNYLYNENEEIRKVIWGYIPLALIFEKALYGVSSPTEHFKELHLQQLQHKVISFEILRNLTAASSHFSELMIGAYDSFVAQQMQRLNFYCEVPETWNQFLVKNLMSYYLFEDIAEDNLGDAFFNNDRFLLQLVKNPEYVKLIVAINYIEDHRYTNITEFTGLDFPSPDLIKVWKRFLELKILLKDEASLCSTVSEQVHLSNQLCEIKLSISWILINLTWKDGEFDFQSDKSRYSMVDTILSSESGATSLNMLVQPEIESSDINDTILGPETRARLLYKHGFSEVLQKLVQDMSVPRMVGLEKKMNRFDHLNSNDVYEKAKAAHYQIVSLVAKRGQTERPLGFVNPPLRRSSNIINYREGHTVHHTPRSPVTENEGEESVVEGNSTAPDEYEEAENESEEIDEYWIR